LNDGRKVFIVLKKKEVFDVYLRVLNILIWFCRFSKQFGVIEGFENLNS
jgi:hypothetical protein